MTTAVRRRIVPTTLVLAVAVTAAVFVGQRSPSCIKATPAPSAAVIQPAAASTSLIRTHDYWFRAEWGGYRPDEVKIVYAQEGEEPRTVSTLEKKPTSWQEHLSVPESFSAHLTVTPRPTCDNEPPPPGFSVSCTVYDITTPSHPEDSLRNPGNVRAHQTSTNGSPAVCAIRSGVRTSAPEIGDTGG